VALHRFLRFEALPGKHERLREELMWTMEPTPAEPLCVPIHLYESMRGR
jgi:hypothetical protein